MPPSAWFAGIDAGSSAVKVVLVRDGRPVLHAQEPTRPDVAAQGDRMLAEARRRAGVDGRLTVLATGYGRKLVERADRHVSEIMAGAMGAGWAWRNWRRLEDVFGEPPDPAELPQPPRTVIDIGGQDSKVITFTDDGMIDRFGMNDRCAAGTGRFLAVMARALETDLVRMDEAARQAARAAPMSATCTVFAESELVSLIGEGRAPDEVAAGVYRSVADRVAGLARQVGLREPVLLSGGPARSGALRAALARALECRVASPPAPEFLTALGAAVLAAEQSPDDC